MIPQTGACSVVEFHGIESRLDLTGNELKTSIGEFGYARQFNKPEPGNVLMVSFKEILNTSIHVV